LCGDFGEWSPRIRRGLPWPLLPDDLVNSPIDPVGKIIETLEDGRRGCGKVLVHLANHFALESLKSKIKISP
jgi:hypothetical protein